MATWIQMVLRCRDFLDEGETFDYVRIFQEEAE